MLTSAGAATGAAARLFCHPFANPMVLRSQGYPLAADRGHGLARLALPAGRCWREAGFRATPCILPLPTALRAAR